MNENESITVTLTLDNDEELECAVLGIFEADSRDYIALLPLDENGDDEDSQVYLYRYIDNGEEEEPGLENILTMLSSNSPQMHSTTGWKNRTSGTSIWTSLTSLFRAVPRQSGKEIPPFRFLFLHNRSSAAPSHGSSPRRRAFSPPLFLSLFSPFCTVSCPRSPQ